MKLLSLPLVAFLAAPSFAATSGGASSSNAWQSTATVTVKLSEINHSGQSGVAKLASVSGGAVRAAVAISGAPPGRLEIASIYEVKGPPATCSVEPSALPVNILGSLVNGKVDAIVDVKLASLRPRRDGTHFCIYVQYVEPKVKGKEKVGVRLAPSMVALAGLRTFDRLTAAPARPATVVQTGWGGGPGVASGPIPSGP